MDSVDLDIQRAIKLPAGSANQVLAQNASGRVDKVVGFDVNGDLTLHPNGAASVAAAEVSRLAADADAVATAADRVQTGIDATNSAASAASFPTHIADIANPHAVTPAQVGALATTSREAANGVAGLDANSEVIKPQAGAAAQVVLGRVGSRKRADGSWDGLAIQLNSWYDLHLWADDLVSGQLYTVLNPTNGPSAGQWYVEVLRHAFDNAGNNVRHLKLTAFANVNYPDGTVFCSSIAQGAWSPWKKTNVGGGSGWLPVTLINGNTQAASEHLGIRKTPDGTVTVSGMIRTPTDGAPAFIIPTGYIPHSMTGTSTILYAPAQSDYGGMAFSQVDRNSANFVVVSGAANWIIVNHSWQVI